MNTSIRNLMITITVFLILSLLFLFAAAQDNRKNISAAYNDVSRSLTDLSSRIEINLESRIRLLDPYATHLTARGEVAEDSIQQLGVQLVINDNLIRNISILKDTTITHVFPLKGNEDAIGIDLAQNDKQRASVLDVKTGGGMTLTGPVNLVQGGQGLIFRVPIFHNDRYWGQTSIVINWDEFLAEVIENGSSQDMNITIISLGKDGRDRQIVLGENLKPGMHYESQIINLPGGQWEISASPLAGWKRFTRSSIFIFITGIIIALIMSGLLFRLLKTHETLEKVAYLDALTGLPNRKLMDLSFQQASGFADRSSLNIAVIVVDLDNFKKINDQFSHEAGDLYLIEFSRRLKGFIRKNDYLFRTGGDEFLLYINGLSDKRDLDSFTSHLREKMKGDIVNDFGSFEASYSYGYSLYPETENLKDLIREADINMYEMKKEHKKGAE